MKTRFLILNGFTFVLGFVGVAYGQYIGNLDQYIGNHTSDGPFPTEPLSLETLNKIK